jgi:hypothetical protein
MPRVGRPPEGSDDVPVSEGPSPSVDEVLDGLRARYLAFAEHEASGLSPLYEELARGVAGSGALLRYVASLPEPKQQPNLLFAAVRHLCGTPRGARHFARLMAEHGEAVRALVLRRSTQTNEPGRCATLLPVLARLPQPLALIEVGASAGLCLLPDRYAYDYGRVRVEPDEVGSAEPPTFPCRASDATPLPSRMPRVAWRAGLDLNPLDVADPAQVGWLETLVWPGQEPRAARLRAAMSVAGEHPVRVVRGDLVDDLPALADEAPADATLVVFHSAVLAYVGEPERERFSRLVRGLGAVWIANESPEVLPRVAAKLERDPPPDRFLLSMDGEPLALAAPHGQSIDWIGP